MSLTILSPAGPARTNVPGKQARYASTFHKGLYYLLPERLKVIKFTDHSTPHALYLQVKEPILQYMKRQKSQAPWRILSSSGFMVIS